jgi:hypothetical protein
MIGLRNRSLYRRVTGRGGGRRLGVMVTSFALLPILADCSSFSFSSAPSSTSAPSSVSPSQSASPSAPKGPKFNHSSLNGSHECKYGTAYCIICHFQPQAAGLRVNLCILPAAPFGRVDWKAGQLLPFLRKQAPKLSCCIDHGRGRRSLRAAFVKVGQHASIDGQAVIGLRVEPRPMIEQLSGSAVFQACPRMGTRGWPGDLDPRRLRNERSKVLGGTHISRSIRARGCAGRQQRKCLCRPKIP